MNVIEIWNDGEEKLTVAIEIEWLFSCSGLLVFTLKFTTIRLFFCSTSSIAAVSFKDLKLSIWRPKCWNHACVQFFKCVSSLVQRLVLRNGQFYALITVSRLSRCLLDFLFYFFSASMHSRSAAVIYHIQDYNSATSIDDKMWARCEGENREKEETGSECFSNSDNLTVSCWETSRVWV